MKQSRRLFFLVAAAICLMAATVVFAVIPANRKRDALQADSERKLAAIARLNAFTAGSAGINVKIGEVRQAIARVETRFPPAGRMNQVVEEIWHLAESNSLQTKTLKTSTGKRTGKYLVQEIDFALAGGLSPLHQFVFQLERLPFAVRVEKMMLNRVAGHDGEMQVDLTLCVLLQPEPTPAPGSVANVSIDR